MKNIKIEVTLEELLLMTTLLSDQLFRRQSSIPRCRAIKEIPRSWRLARTWSSASSP